MSTRGQGCPCTGGPPSAGDREGAQCQLRHWPTREAEGHGTFTASGPTRPLRSRLQAVEPCEQLPLTGGAPGEGPGPGRPWEAGPYGQEGVSRLLPGPGGGSHSQTPWAKIRQGGLPGDTPEWGKGAERPQLCPSPQAPRGILISDEVPLFPGSEQLAAAVLCVGPGSPPEDASCGRAPPLPPHRHSSPRPGARRQLSAAALLAQVAFETNRT